MTNRKNKQADRLQQALAGREVLKKQINEVFETAEAKAFQTFVQALRVYIKNKQKKND